MICMYMFMHKCVYVCIYIHTHIYIIYIYIYSEHCKLWCRRKETAIDFALLGSASESSPLLLPTAACSSQLRLAPLSSAYQLGPLKLACYLLLIRYLLPLCYSTLQHNTYIHICVCTMYIYIYIHMLYIYIYIYVYRERE